MFTLAIIAITVFAHIILPIIFLVWIFKSKSNNRLQWLSIVTFSGSYILLMFKGGAGWSWFGLFWPYLFLIGFVIVAAISCSRLKKMVWLPDKKFRPWMDTLIQLALTVAFAGGIPATLTARNHSSENAIKLTFPLRGGTFHIGQGGSNVTMNHHFNVSAQKYALDIAQLNSAGIRAKGFLPKDLNSYAIFNTDVIAPCSGEVIASESILPDQVPLLETDQENLLGNHIVIFCDGVSVLLAHLKQNSSKVKVGDLVQTGDHLAQVGNSGNSSEPHLHVHAVKGKHSSKEEIAFSAEGVPMFFNQKFFIRNDRIRSPHEQSR